MPKGKTVGTPAKKSKKPEKPGGIGASTKGKEFIPFARKTARGGKTPEKTGPPTPSPRKRARGDQKYRAPRKASK
jgi:hypothetical protein